MLASGGVLPAVVFFSVSVERLREVSFYGSKDFHERDMCACVM